MLRRLSSSLLCLYTMIVIKLEKALKSSCWCGVKVGIFLSTLFYIYTYFETNQSKLPVTYNM